MLFFIDEDELIFLDCVPSEPVTSLRKENP